MKIGDTIYHPLFGACELQRIDNTTYSIPMVIVAIKEAVEAGQVIYRSICEFSETEL